MMTTQAPEVIDYPPVKAPATIQARRVFLLARLLTAATAILCAVGHAALLVILNLDGDAPLPDIWPVDCRVWLAILLFWTAVMLLARKRLRLHT